MFLPKNYEAPQESDGYLKFKKGDTKFRILSAPVVGWEDWSREMKPVRFHYDKKPAHPIREDRPIKHFWSMVVWDYGASSIKILHITQASVRKAITGLLEDQDWGAPYSYDIKVNKTGDDMKTTKYVVNPCPHSPVASFIERAFYEKPIYLEALFEGKNPFHGYEGRFTAAQAAFSKEPPAEQKHSVKEFEDPFVKRNELKFLEDSLKKEGVDTSFLEGFIQQIAATKNVNVEAVAESANMSTLFPKFKSMYQDHVISLSSTVGSAEQDEAVPF